MTNNKRLLLPVQKNWKAGTLCFNIFSYAVALILFAFMITGCGDNADVSGGSDSSDSGAVIIGLTDADGDFSTYTADVLSLTLTRADGSVVETLPLSTRIDFARYTDMTEFITAATVPSGVYIKAHMKLDYSNADIQLEMNGGAAAASVKDENGQDIQHLEVEVRLSDRKSLLVRPGIPAHLTLDFDLKASNEVDITVSPPLVTVEPLLIADVNPERPKIHRVRGLLRDVDLEEGSFSVIIRPLHLRTGDFGTLNVLVNEETHYEIDGDAHTGKEGLIMLDKKPSGTAVVAVGDLDTSTRQFKAREVYAGSSVPGGALDVVRGNVIARNGNNLTVRGATLIRMDGTMVFHDNVLVMIGPETKVTRLGVSSKELGTDDISVGQQINAFGTMASDELPLLQSERPLILALDATRGHVRMHMTTLTGNVVSVDTKKLVIDLQSIDYRNVSFFNFTGTGIDNENDADPRQYEIATGNLDLNGLTPSDPVKVRGFVRPYGQAPVDFEALTVVDVSHIRAYLGVSWKDPGSATPFENISAKELVIELDEEVGKLHHLLRGGVWTDLFDLGRSPVVQPRDENRGLFAIRRNGVVMVYTDFENFAQSLEKNLMDSATMKYLSATGSFNNTSATLTADSIGVKLVETRDIGIL